MEKVIHVYLVGVLNHLQKFLPSMLVYYGKQNRPHICKNNIQSLVNTSEEHNN